MQSPHLLILSGVWPHYRGNLEAANVISHQITKCLVQSGKFSISYAIVNSQRPDLPDAGEVDVTALREQGVTFLEPILVPAQPVGGRGVLSKTLSVMRGRPDRLMIGTGFEGHLLERFGGARPDAVLCVWAETAGYLASRLPVPRFNYAGNPDHKVVAARLELAERLGRTTLAGRLRNAALTSVVKAGHLQAMRRFNLMWNVAANDAAEYVASGVRARYLQNMWPGEINPGWLQARTEREQTYPVKIIGNVGNLLATGNSLGLITLATEILPALKQRLGEGQFEIHLFGGGTPHSAVAPLLQDSHFRLRGFVADLDAEILSAPIFLVANNSRRFKVGHTRFLHAWSLGACVVGFHDSTEAMPEIVHRRNALLGRDAAEVADLIVEAAQDRWLRREIGEIGMETLAAAFNPSRVVEQIGTDIAAHLEGRNAMVSGE